MIYNLNFIESVYIRFYLWNDSNRRVKHSNVRKVMTYVWRGWNCASITWTNGSLIEKMCRIREENQL